MADVAVELWQFCHSNYNEKVRWTLDLKAIPHRRTSLLPGPHRRVLRPLTGRTLTPTVRIEGGAPIDDSTRIVEALEARWPEPALLPADPDERAEVLTVTRRLDEGAGKAARLAYLGLAFASLPFAAAGYAADASTATRLMFTAAFPPIRTAIRKAFGITPDTIVRARADVTAELERVAETTRATGYLVGDRFSLADLTAACHLGLAVGDRPNTQPRAPGAPDALRAWWAGNRSTPGGRWVLDMFERHHPPHGAAAVA